MSQYILSLLTFVSNNSEQYFANSEIRNINTCDNQIKKSTNNIKTTWNIIKKETNRHKRLKNVTHHDNSPEAFNNYFLTVSENIIKNI